MFKKIKELKFKVKLAVMIFVIIFISTVILAIYSTIKVVQLENIIEEYIQCGDGGCAHMM